MGKSKLLCLLDPQKKTDLQTGQLYIGSTLLQKRTCHLREIKRKCDICEYSQKAGNKNGLPLQHSKLMYTSLNYNECDTLILKPKYQWVILKNKNQKVMLDFCLKDLISFINDVTDFCQ